MAQLLLAVNPAEAYSPMRKRNGIKLKKLFIRIGRHMHQAEELFLSLCSP